MCAEVLQSFIRIIVPHWNSGIAARAGDAAMTPKGDSTAHTMNSGPATVPKILVDGLRPASCTPPPNQPIAVPRQCLGRPLPERCKMTRILLAGAAALGMMTGVALAQSTTSETTTTSSPAYVVPPPGTLSSSTRSKSIAPDGTRTDSRGTTYRNTNGVASDSESRTTSYPPPVATTTTRDSSTTITR
jgi:hypothetical protein